MTLDLTITDMYCGAGGSTTGCIQAGGNVQLAINHWDRAIETHNTNYPNVKHALTDLLTARPNRFPRSTILVASPECTSHSLAKGKKGKNYQGGLFEDEPDLSWEAEERSRCTMWTPLEWAEHHGYEAVVMENVVDVHKWQPLPAWLHAWDCLGYDVECVYFNSMHAHPTPQNRDRVYIVATKKKNRKPDLQFCPLAYCPRCEKDVESIQCWKPRSKKWGKYKTQYNYCCPHCSDIVTPYYYAAANAIDWSLPIERIGDRKKPLQPKTMERIAYGLEKFAREYPFTVDVTKSTDRLRSLMHEAMPTQVGHNGLGMAVPPFLLNLNHEKIQAISVMHNPFQTQTTYDDNGLVVPPPFLMQTSHSQTGHGGYVSSAYEAPFSTQTTRQDLALIMPFIAELHGTSKAREVTEALATVCAGGQHHGLVVPPFILDHLGEYRPRDINGPMSTICAAGNHHSLVVPPSEHSWLMTYCRTGSLTELDEAATTVTTVARHALVTSDRANVRVEDCGFRMLSVEEIRAAMAFPEDYQLLGTRRERVKLLGNAVTPPVMQMIMERVIASLAA